MQSAEQPNCRQTSTVGENVGTVDGATVGGTVGTTVRGTAGPNVLQPAQVNAHKLATAGDSMQSPFVTSRRQVERLTSSLSRRSAHTVDEATVGSTKVGVGVGFKDIAADVGSGVFGAGVGATAGGMVDGGPVLDVGKVGVGVGFKVKADVGSGVF